MGSNVLARARALDMASARAIAVASGGASSIMASGLGAAKPEAIVSRPEAGTARPVAIAAMPETGVANPVVVAARADNAGVARTEGAMARDEAGRAAAAWPSMESGRPSSSSGGGVPSMGIEGMAVLGLGVTEGTMASGWGWNGGVGVRASGT